MEDLGFKASVLQPGVFHHDQREILVTVHVDDFLASGTGEQLQWLAQQLQQRYDLKYNIISREKGDVQETTFLNRVIRWRKDNVIEFVRG